MVAQTQKNLLIMENIDQFSPAEIYQQMENLIKDHKWSEITEIIKNLVKTPYGRFLLEKIQCIQVISSETNFVSVLDILYMERGGDYKFFIEFMNEFCFFKIPQTFEVTGGIVNADWYLKDNNGTLCSGHYSRRKNKLSSESVNQIELVYMKTFHKYTAGFFEDTVERFEKFIH